MSPKRRRTDATSDPAQLAALGAGDPQVRALLHELQVHSEEITVQNEQLLKAQAELEDARDRYADLFDFSPIGYLSLDANAVIREINMVATAMFGRERMFLLGVPLINLIDPGGRTAFRRFLNEATGSLKTSAEVEVTLPLAAPRILRIVSRQVQHRHGPLELFTALLDVTEQRRLENATAIALAREQERGAELAEEIDTRAAAEERVKALLERLVTVQEQERKRLALNLHDHLGQQLTGLRLALANVRDIADRAEQAKRFELIDQIVAQLDRDVDFLAWELRPAALDDVGLQPSIRDFVHRWATTTGVQADFHCTPEEIDRLPGDVESNLYRIMQEALNNISKHAEASHASVLLERKTDEVTLIVEDDGCGLKMADELSRLGRDGMGLSGIRERTALVGGSVEIESTPGQGTTLFIRVPLSVRGPSESS